MSATGQSVYGDPSSFASSSAAGAFALAAQVYGADPRFADYARDLARRADLAWRWVVLHPDETFSEPKAAQGRIRLAADAIEVDAAGRASDRLAAAAHLFVLTNRPAFARYVDAHWTDAGDDDFYVTTALLAYKAASRGRHQRVPAVPSHYSADVTAQERGDRDPYRAFLGHYGWASNETKSDIALLFVQRAAGRGRAAKADLELAAGYLHYLHGVNPLGKVYLSNMGAFGATNSVDSFFHGWFAEGSRWASVSASVAGPPPGYLVGGPNVDYTWDSGCPAVSRRCGTAPPSPPAGQPPQKSYKDFGTSWPLDSWSVTEPDVMYQAAYIRLLSNYVD